MKLISIQVGMPKEVEFRGEMIRTGIFKDPVRGPVKVKTLSLEGDGQADLKVHGGVDKAVYAYSLDAYPWWQQKRPQDTFENGAFGENLCIDVIKENQTYIGDTFEIGGAVLQVAQPRYPCFKLGIKFKDQRIIKTFMESDRPGVYFRVLREGLIEAGQEIKLIDREKIHLSILDLFKIAGGLEFEESKVKDYLKIKALPANFRRKFQAMVTD